MKMHVDLQKRFPIYHVCPKCMEALLCGVAPRRKASTILQVSDVVGISTANRFSILKIPWIVHTNDFILQFLLCQIIPIQCSVQTGISDAPTHQNHQQCHLHQQRPINSVPFLNLNWRVQHHGLALSVHRFAVIRDNPSSSFSTVNPSEQSSLVLTASRSPIFVNTKRMHPKNSWSELHHDPEQFNLPLSSQSVNGLDHCVNVFSSCIWVDPTTKDFGIFTFFAALTSWTLWWFFDPIFRDRCSCVLGLCYCRWPQLCSAAMLELNCNRAPLPCCGDSHTPMLPCFGCAFMYRCHDRKKCICSATRLLGRHPSRCSAQLLLAFRVSRRVSLACARCRGSTTHGLLTENNTGVLWVLTRTRVMLTQAKWWNIRASTRAALVGVLWCAYTVCHYAVVTFCTVFFLHSRVLNLYNPSKMSSCGIKMRIPSHFESNSWVLSFRREMVNRST